MKGIPSALMALAVTLAAGCGTTYRWTSDVPEEMRTVSVPTFRNDSNVTELGSVMTRQVLREFQREGTFRIRRAGDAALEVQGVVKTASTAPFAYDRRLNTRRRAYDLTAQLDVSVVDKRAGRVLIDNRRYTARTTYTATDDILTAERDASGRLAEDLARQVVDDVLNMNWKTQEGKSK